MNLFHELHISTKGLNAKKEDSAFADCHENIDNGYWIKASFYSNHQQSISPSV
jgi:hypothetical protein